MVEKKSGTMVVTIVWGTVLIRGWLLMLLLGGLHHEVSGDVPAVGFLLSVGIAWVIGLLLSLLRLGR